MPSGKFSLAVRSTIKDRANGYCERCGLPLRRGGQVHHRRPRGMGGTSTVEAGSVSNGCWVHPHCHLDVERNREKSLSEGWLVQQGKDPQHTPIYRQGKWVYLRETGAVIPIPSDASALLDRARRSGR